MAFLDEQLLAGARDFLAASLEAAVKEDERSVLIAYHGDGDGCCAAYFMQKYMRQPAGYYWVGTSDFDFAGLENTILRAKPFLTLLLDMPVYNRPEMIEKLCSERRVFIYDHHYPGTFQLSEEKENLLYVNPVVSGSENAFPTALFGWELLEEKEEFDKEVLFMGLFSETWLDKIPIFDEFNLNCQERLKEISRRIHSSFLISDMSETHYALNFLLNAATAKGLENRSFESVTGYETLDNIYNLVQNEKKWLLSRLNAEIKRLIEPKFILKSIESKMRLCGIIASELRWKYPDLVIGIWQRWKQKFHCELRRGEKCGINLASLIENIRCEVELTSGGGHPAAAGFTAERDGFFQALDKIRPHLSDSTQSGDIGPMPRVD